MRVFQISNLLALFTALLFLGACASVKTTDSAGDADSGSATIAGVDSVDGVYVGSDTVKELATGVPDRVFLHTIAIQSQQEDLLLFKNKLSGWKQIQASQL